MVAPTAAPMAMGCRKVLRVARTCCMSASQRQGAIIVGRGLEGALGGLGFAVRPEALVVFFYQYRQEGPRCFLLPRTAVIEMAIYVDPSNGGGKQPGRRAFLRYRDENGQTQPFFLPMVGPPFSYTGRWNHLDEMPKPPELKERYLYYQLERWIETGEFVWPTSRAIHM